MSLTPEMFTKRVEHVCRDVGDYPTLRKAAAHLMVEAFGDNAGAYLVGMERLIKKLQELNRKPKRYGPSVESLQGRDT